MIYSELVEECKQIIIEFHFTARWMRIEGFHRVGKLVLKEDLPSDKIASLARQIDITPKDMALAILLAEKYPDLNDLPAGKNISWSQIEEYL